MQKFLITDQVGYQLRRASTVMMADLRDRLDKLDVSPTQASILLLLQDNPTLIQSEIGNTLGIKRANMVPLMNKLKAKGFVIRQSIDGRSYKFEITDLGYQTLEQIRQEISAHEQFYLQRFSQETIEMLRSELPKFWR